MKISVLGAGSWGTTLACLLANNGHQVYLWEINKQAAEKLDKEREIIDKLCQIQMLVRSIHPNVHDIRINMRHCYDNPLEYGNNYDVIGAKSPEYDSAYCLSISTFDNELGKTKRMERCGYKLPNEFEYSRKTIQIK